MPNYNYTALSIDEMHQATAAPSPATRWIVADVGMALLVLVMNRPSEVVGIGSVDPGIPFTAVGPVPEGFRLNLGLASKHGMPPDNKGGINWTQVDTAGVDLEAWCPVRIFDPMMTQTSPSPTMVQWCTACGGIADEAG